MASKRRFTRETGKRKYRQLFVIATYRFMVYIR